MCLLKALAFWFCICGSVLLAEETRNTIGDTQETSSPRATFKITQRYDGSWRSVIDLTKGNLPAVPLTNGFPWPALFEISPDDQWMLQVQKSGSGENVSFLYRLEPSGRLWRMEPQFGELAFAFLKHSQGVRTEELYHTGIEFRSWNLEAGLLRFRIRGKPRKESDKGVDREIIYDLKEHAFRLP